VDISEMTPADVPAVSALIDQLHADRPGVLDPARIRQGWKTFVARDERGAPIGFALGTFIDYGLRHESSGTLEQLVVDESARGAGVGEALVESWKQWLRDEGLTLGFLSAAEDAVRFYERCGFQRTTGPWLVWAEEQAEEPA
jgi:GNAT superfamily N-acetyltransferase